MKKYLIILIVILISVNMNNIYGQNFSFYLSDVDKFLQDSVPQVATFPDMKKNKDYIRMLIFKFGVGTKNKKFYAGSQGLWSTVPVYNFVDGFWLGQSFFLLYKRDKDHEIEIDPMVYYNTASKSMTWEVKSDFRYSQRMEGKFSVNGGKLSVDYDNEEHLGRLENSLYSLGLGKNYMKLYKKKYVEIKNDFYPLPGIRLYCGLSMQWRSIETNHTTFCIIRSDDFDRSNIPDNKLYRPMPHNKALIWDIGTDITFNNLRKDHKSNIIIYSGIPTFSAHLIGSIPVGNEARSKFLRLDISVNQRFNIDKYSTLEYKVGGGSFLEKHRIWFPDFMHFGAYGLPSMRTYTNDGYFLIGYYTADTDKGWVKGSSNFMSENFLLSKVRALHKLGVSEGLHLRYLWTSAIKSYEEFGYSVGIKNYIRLGLYIGFDGYHYNNIGVSVSFPWLSGGY